MIRVPKKYRRLLAPASAAALVGVVLLAWMFRTGVIVSGTDAIAREAVLALIEAPTDLERLRQAARLDDTDDALLLIEGLNTQVTFDFLRARHHQGADLDVRPAGESASAPPFRTVGLRVSESGNPSADAQLLVRLEDRPERGWRVVRVELGGW